MKRGMMVGMIALLLAVAGCEDSATGLDDRTAVPVAVHIVEQGTVLGSLGETVRLTARVTDDRGEPVPNASVVWSSSDPGILSGGDGGSFTSRANGEVTVVAQLEDGSVPGSSVRVVVRQVPAEIRVADTAPGEPFRLWQLGSNVRPDAWWVDAGGNRVEGMNVPLGWSSLDPDVVQVSPGNLFTARRDGTARMIAFHDGFEMEMEVEVVAGLPVTGCIRFESSPGGEGVEECGSLELTFVDRR